MADIEFEDEIQEPQTVSQFYTKQQEEQQRPSFISGLLLKTGLIKDQRSVPYVLLIIAVLGFAVAIAIQVVPRISQNNTIPTSQILEITPPAKP
jgi:hypothetical protein